MAPPPPPHETDEHGQDASASMEDDMHAPLWTLMLESGGTPNVANNDEVESGAALDVSNPGEWQTVKRPRRRRRHTSFYKAPSLHFIECEPNLNRVAPEQDFWELVETHLDSGAARSICPIDFCPEFPVTETGSSRKQEHFRTATGGRVRNEGQRKISGVTENGIPVSMAYAVADIAVTLESVAQICDSGATVTFTAKRGDRWSCRPSSVRKKRGRVCPKNLGQA